jgi:hypothetical protein
MLRQQPIHVGIAWGQLVTVHPATRQIQIGELWFDADHPFVENSPMLEAAKKYLN